MVSHEAIGVSEPGIPLDDLSKKGQKAFPVCVSRIDGSARVAAAGPMLQSPRKGETQGACPRRTMEEGVHRRCRPAPL